MPANSQVPGWFQSPSPTATLSQPAVPASGAYIGAWVNPRGLFSKGGANEIPQLERFNTTVGRPMAILHAYNLFDAPLSLSTLDAIAANGSIPLVDWSCANVDGVVSGYHDATIKLYAQTLKTFGKPVFLRWYWEMNEDNAARVKCGGYRHGQDFIAAWKRIWDIFHSTGAANVAFVWCPSANGDASDYYPGDAYIDWVGADRYDRTMLGGGGFDYLFGDFYAQWSPHNKPMMVGETAATAPDQWRYLSGVLRAVPARYPLIKAVIYFDAPSINGSWPLESGGMDAFKTLANSSYFTVP